MAIGKQGLFHGVSDGHDRFNMRKMFGRFIMQIDIGK